MVVNIVLGRDLEGIERGLRSNVDAGEKGVEEGRCGRVAGENVLAGKLNGVERSGGKADVGDGG